MTPEQAIDIGREALVVMLVISAPILLLGMVVGLVISILQAVTQVQEQTLSFVPKIIVMGLAVALFMPWIISKLLHFSEDMFSLAF
ncbi:MAG TPA: flagellar biosynthesis protein FliQ [Phycisphaerae bacterium]|nr:flagellar biosynthesis protein FliQ [Phycisphaerae bacterium]HOI54638.1 flagellar biosynthesis protein FliQ [Phycisphaerae bacterium]